MNGCECFADIIGAYLYGHASQQECDELENHVASCASCRMDIEQRRATLSVLTPEIPTAAEHDRIIRSVRLRIARECEQTRAKKIRLALRFTTAFGIACALFASGLSIGRHTVEPRTIVKVVTKTVSQPETQVPVTTIAKLDQLTVKPVVKSTPPPVKIITRYRYRVIVEHRPEKKVEPVKEVQADARVIAPIPLGVDDARYAFAGN